MSEVTLHPVGSEVLVCFENYATFGRNAGCELAEPSSRGNLSTFALARAALA